MFRYDPANGKLDRFAGGGIVTPNFPVVDEARGALFVSDSHRFGTPGGGIWRYDLATGEGICGRPSRWSSPTAWP